VTGNIPKWFTHDPIQVLIRQHTAKSGTHDLLENKSNDLTTTLSSIKNCLKLIHEKRQLKFLTSKFTFLHACYTKSCLFCKNNIINIDNILSVIRFSMLCKSIILLYDKSLIISYIVR